MPSFPPRTEPVKKRQQLAQKRNELQMAIRKGLSIEKLNKSVEKYRAAQLSMFKAMIHEIHEKEFQKKPQLLEIRKLESDILIWTNKATEEIISEIKAEL